MKIYSVSDYAFKPYGKVLTGFDTAALVAAMKTIPMPESGTAYEPGDQVLKACGILMKCGPSLRRHAHPDRHVLGLQHKAELSRISPRQ